MSTDYLYLNGLEPREYSQGNKERLMKWFDGVFSVVTRGEGGAGLKSLLVSCSEEIVSETISSIGGKISMDRLKCLGAAAMSVAAKLVLDKDIDRPLRVYATATGNMCDVGSIKEMERDLLQRSDWQGCKNTLNAASEEVKTQSPPSVLKVSKPISLNPESSDYIYDFEEYFLKEFGKCTSKYPDLLKAFWKSGIPLKDDTLISDFWKYNNARRKEGFIRLVNDIEYAIRFKEYVNINALLEDEDSDGNVTYTGVKYVERPEHGAVAVNGWPSVYTTGSSYPVSVFTELMLDSDYPYQEVLIKELTPVSISGDFRTFKEQIDEAVSSGLYIDVDDFDTFTGDGVREFRVFSRKIPYNDYIMIPGHPNVYYTAGEGAKAMEYINAMKYIDSMTSGRTTSPIPEISDSSTGDSLLDDLGIPSL